MSNHDVVRHASRYGLPQVKTQWYHQLADAWLLRSGSNFIEDRELGTRRARAAIMMELGLPGSVYVYQGEELGLFEVADIPWDRLEDPTPFRTDHGRTAKGARRLPCAAAVVRRRRADPGAVGCEVRHRRLVRLLSGHAAPDGTPAADPHLPQPLWYKDFAADVEDSDPDSMLNLYRRAIAFRQRMLTPTGDTSIRGSGSPSSATRPARWWRIRVSAPTRAVIASPASPTLGGFRRTAAGEIIFASEPISGFILPADTTVWMMI